MQRKLKSHSRKTEKGQVLVILALTIVGLVAIMGLAIDMGYMYVSYARLRRSVDSAALSATAQFKRGATPSLIYNAAKQFLDLNNEPTTSIKIDNCYWEFDGSSEHDEAPYVSPTNPGGSGDTDLCPSPPRKLIRVTASEAVPTFFLSVIGWRSLPITAEAISEAASLEMVMVIDQSESMAWYQASPHQTDEIPSDSNGDYPLSRDPAYCNNFNDEPHACHPFYEVKQAAQSFVDNYIYYPYDRVAIVTFAKHATIYNPVDGSTISNPADLATTPALSNNIADLDNTIQGLSVTEGARSCMHQYDGTVGSYGGPAFPNGYDTWNTGWFNDPIDHPDPWTWTSAGEDEVPCRLYNVILPDGWPSDDPAEQHLPPDESSMLFRGFSCPQGIASSDYSRCWTSNIGEGLADAAQIYKNTPDLRQQALWVTLLLTDGNANAAYYGSDLTNPYCPAGERDRHPMPAEGSPPTARFAPYCRDDNTLVRHCLPAIETVGTYECMGQNYGKPGDGGHAAFYWPTAPINWYSAYPETNNLYTNVESDTLYDADDYARDQADALSDGAHVSIFAIGLGAGVTSDQKDYVWPGTPPAGLALLQYIAQKGGTDQSYQASNTDLPAVFLAIANKIATRLTH